MMCDIETQYFPLIQIKLNLLHDFSFSFKDQFSCKFDRFYGKKICMKMLFITATNISSSAIILPNDSVPCTVGIFNVKNVTVRLYN